MRIQWWPCLPLTVLFGVILSSSPTGAQNKDIVGRVERVRIYPGNLVLRAKLDTGAKTCSLHAPRITKFEKNGETWVRFSVKDHRGLEATIERKIVRQARIKRSSGEPEVRLVVLLGVCLGTLYREVEVNLVDRAEFNYPMLIGRSFMIGHILVDPELKYTSEPACMGAPKP
jgi:hypothetical protein